MSDLDSERELLASPEHLRELLPTLEIKEFVSKVAAATRDRSVTTVARAPRGAATRLHALERLARGKRSAPVRLRPMRSQLPDRHRCHAAEDPWVIRKSSWRSS